MHVLVVEDDDDVAQMIWWMLKRIGHTALIAPSSESAVQLVENNELFDAFLIDFMLAGSELDGFQLSQLFLGMGLGPIVLTSASPTMLKKQENYDESEVRVLYKPFTTDELDEALR